VFDLTVVNTLVCLPSFQQSKVALVSEASLLTRDLEKIFGGLVLVLGFTELELGDTDIRFKELVAPICIQRIVLSWTGRNYDILKVPGPRKNA